MRTIKIVLDFIKLIIAEKIEFGKNVWEKMTGNVKFKDTVISLDALKAANDLLQSRYQAKNRLIGGLPKIKLKKDS